MDLIRKAIPIKDTDIDACINQFDFKNKNKHLIPHELFTKKHRQWIGNSKQFKINFDFNHAYVTYGVTDAFSDFYFQHKKIQVLTGEYNYHKDLGIKELDHIGEIEPYSALIISYPFSATGSEHPDWKNIIEVCEACHVSVFLDVCFFGVAYDLDLSVPECVTHVAFSFSKMFDTACYRTGVLYTRYKKLTPISNQNLYYYHNHLGAQIHNQIMNNFDCDYLTNKHKHKHVEICDAKGIDVTNTLLFGTSNEEKWNLFERGITNRMCLSHMFSA